MSNHNSDSLFIGIDGGGTKCRARLVSMNETLLGTTLLGTTLLGTGVGGPSNPLHGLAQTKASILQAVEMALTEAGLPSSAANNVVVGIGLAGVNLPSLFAAMKNWQHPFQQMHLTTDLHIACLGAHNSDQGAVMIAGTGSCGYSFVNNKATILGGHGFPFGDQGSGAWMGLEAVKAVLLGSDNLGPYSLMSDLIESHLQAKGVMIVDRMGAAQSRDYAHLARFVLDAADAKDEVAEKIVREGAYYLSTAAEKLWETGPSRMSFMGGLSERLTPWLKPEIATRFSTPLNQPEFGAIYYAKQQENLLVF